MMYGFAMANPYAIPIFVMKTGRPTPLMGFRSIRQVVHRLPSLSETRFCASTGG
ncbi:MAG: hypothetical protein SH821_05370 [Phototrophicales bacterium]|nr:hypothetical protein [Phototrophicales bacterium]